jgi:hypothetical protein
MGISSPSSSTPLSGKVRCRVGVCRIMFNQQMEFAAGEPLIGVSATGQTQAAVDIALEFNGRYPHNPLIAITSLEQSRDAAPVTWRSKPKKDI